MSAARPITIVGGGLAGLTLGITLRKRNVPVTIFEAGHYPRHRVCGEFISGRGLKVLEDLGLREKFSAAGARIAETAAFFSPKTSSGIKRLPEPALCLSRWRMDGLLAEEFERLGGDLKTNQRWSGNFVSEGIVRATGRRIQAEVDGWRWFGLKAHAKNLSLLADLEMHLVKDGYVGLCQLDGGTVNVCGLFRSREPIPGLVSRWKDFLCGSEGSHLHQRLGEAEFDEESFCSVAGISLKPCNLAETDEVSVGDAFSMIAPVTGNGMSLAIESARIASDSILDFSAGKVSWIETKERVSGCFRHQFRRRLNWAKNLQWSLFHPPWSNLVVYVTGKTGVFWSMAYGKTR